MLIIASSHDNVHILNMSSRRSVPVQTDAQFVPMWNFCYGLFFLSIQFDESQGAGTHSVTLKDSGTESFKGT